MKSERSWYLVRIGLRLLLFAAVSLGLVFEVAAQSYFDIETISVRSERSGNDARVDLYARVPYTSLRFLSQADGFRAQYDLSAAIHRLDQRGRPQSLVRTAQWSRTVAAPVFVSTQADTVYDFSSHSITLPPGEYQLELRLEDRSSRQSVSRQHLFEVRDFSGAVSLSDLVVLERYDTSNQTITPNISNTVDTDQTSFLLFYEVYLERARRLRLTYEVVRSPAARSMLSSVKAFFGLGDVPGAEISYSAVDMISMRTGRNPATLSIPMNQLKAGDYIVRVMVQDEQARVLDHAEKAITIRWSGLNEHIRDLNTAIAQLRYIAKEKEIRQIASAPTEAERLARFMAFWKKRDPSPGSERNERMEEYYHRIFYASRLYGRSADGWQTDRGEVFVRFGEPDSIERNPAISLGNRPFEVWSYSRIGRRFIFVDRSGQGNFELLVPIWDERTRM